MAEIDMTAPTVAPVVGAWGRLRNGKRVGPMMSTEAGNIYAIDGADTGAGFVSWLKSGRFTHGGNNGADLIAIIPAPDSVEPDATQETGVVVDIVCETVRVLHRGGVVFVEIAKDLDGGDAGIATVHDGTSVVKMTPAAAVAIARAILRMAGESK